jgi:hypothetical protein
MDLYGHLFEGSDTESAEKMQKIFGGRDSASPASEKVVPFSATRKKA